MKAIILAAGRGSRLGEKSAGKPKCLLQVGRRPLIEHQLGSLAEAGVAPVLMVVGYCSDEIREVVGIRAEYVENPRWSSTNSLYSFSLTREWIDGPVVVLNSDVLFDPSVLEKVLDADGDAFAYDSSSGDAREHMKVKVESGVLVKMSKSLPVEESDGENVGLLKFTAKSAERLLEITERIVAEGGERDWLGTAVQRLAEERPIRAVDIRGLAWGEVDSAYDLDRMRKRVLPAISRAARRRSTPWFLGRLAAIAGVLALMAATGYLAHMWYADETVWDSVEATGATPVRLAAGPRSQSWFLLDGEQTARSEIGGPGVVRIESRVVRSSSAGSAAEPYVLEVKLDSRRVGWFTREAVASTTWKLEGAFVGQHHSIELEVPRFAHRVEVRLVAAPSGRCLVRIRQAVEASSTDSPEDD